jgi:hypothetical protein
MDASTFVNPSAEYRVLPFWFWNGAIEEGEVVRQIKEMSDKGIGGFCLSPGPGLQIPHLSSVWFERVKLAAETAKSLGLKVWLHEEYPHPGSMVGEKVALGFPQYRAQHLSFRETTVQGGQQVDMDLPWGTVLSAIAVPLKRDRCLWDDAVDISGFIGSNHRQEIYLEKENRYTYHDKHFDALNLQHRLYWKAPAGRWRVLVFLQKEYDQSETQGSQFDPYNADAMAHFVETTREPSVSYLEEFFGDTIPAILTTDRTHRGNRLPWSPLLPDAFLSRNEYDLLACLPALITAFGPNTSRIRYDYFQTLSELLRDNYHGTSIEWCSQHNVKHAADVPVFRNAHQGSVQIPGTAGGSEKVGATESKEWKNQTAAYRKNPKFTASLIHQNGEGRVANTCFQDTGWSLTLQDMKWSVDRLGAMGCNLFNFHGFSYTIDGLRKHHAPPSLFQQNPYWKHFRLLSDYTGRLSYMLSQGKRVVNIAMLDPVTSLWSHLAHPHVGWQYAGYDGDEEKLSSRLAEDWAYLSEYLNQIQRDFDTLDPETLEDARVSGARLHVGDANYDILIIPPITNLERPAFECIRQFVNSGGKVICLGLLPVEDIQEGPSVVEAFSRMTDMDPDRMIRDYVGHELGVHVIQRGNLYLIRTGGSVVRNKGAKAMGDLLEELSPRLVAVDTDKKGISALLCHHRETEKEKIIFLTNTTQSSFESRVALRFPAKYKQVERWDLETGRRSAVPTEKTGNRLSVDLVFNRLESHLLVVSEGKVQKPTVPAQPMALSLDLKAPWKVDPEEDNCLRLDRFRMQFDTHNRGTKQGWHKPDYKDSRWISVQPKPFVEQIRGLSPLPNLPFTFESEGSNQPYSAKLKLPLVCWFRTTFSSDVVPGKLALVMDRSAILGNHQIYLNGSRLPSNAFRPTFRYDHANVTCAVGRRVNRGKNVIAIRVEIEKLTDGILDAFYLFGRFGVKRWRNEYLRLSSVAERGNLAALDELRMPYYAGTIAYTKDVHFARKYPHDRFVLSLDKELKEFSDIIEVIVNGHSLGVRAWAPYGFMGETSWLKPTRNRVVVRITNTLSRLITGQEFRPRPHRMMPVRI